MKDAIRYILIMLLGIGLLVTLFFNYTSSKQLENDEKRISEIKVPKAKSFNKSMTPNEVEELEKVVKGKIDDFLLGQYQDDTSGNGSAYDVLRGVFVSNSNPVIINEKTSEKEHIKYYEPFEYKISNFSGQYNEQGKEVMMNISVKHDGEVSNELYTLISFQLDNDNKMIGGALYGEER